MRRGGWLLVGLVACAVGVIALTGRSGGGKARGSAGSTTIERPTAVPTSRPGLSTTTSSASTTSTSTAASPSSSVPVTVPTTAPTHGLQGKVITINPGHDGGNAAHVTEINQMVWIRTGYKACDTAGTEANNGYPEHAFTWDTSLRVAAKLRALGATVVMTRTNDTGWGPCINQRAAIGNQAHSAAVVSIHADGGPATGRGFFVIAPAHTTGLSNALYDSSGLLASAVRDAVRSGTSMPTSDYSGSAGFERSGIYGGLNLTEVPAMFIECGNMRNAQDAALLETAAYRDQLASAIVTGITAFVS